METEVKYIIDLFDKVFKQLEQKPLLENCNFQIETELTTEHFLRFNSIEKEDRIKMSFEIKNDGMTFWLDRAREIPEWSMAHITKKQGEIEKELKQLFDSEILIEYKGNRTRIVLLNKSGIEVRRFSYYEGLAINWLNSTTKKKCRPYFEI